MKKISFTLLLFSVICFSQKRDAYYILDNSSNDYIIFAKNGKITKQTNINSIDYFSISLRKDYTEYLKQIELEKKENPGIENMWALGGGPKLNKLEFSVISKSKELISIDKFKDKWFVDYNWLRANSWKENNDNIVFKNLYFLIKVDYYQYQSFKVGRTLTIN